MRTPMSEILDLALTQAIEHYIEMEPELAYDAIVDEWPEQIAIILVEFLFRTTCGACNRGTDFVQVPRQQGDTMYIVPLCSCKWEGQ